MQIYWDSKQTLNGKDIGDLGVNKLMHPYD